MAAKRSDLATIDAQLAKEAANVSEQVGQPDGRRVSVSQQDGNFMGPGGINLGNELNIIVVDFCSANRYYDRTYDASTPMPPACVAFGDVIKEMVPESESPAIQSTNCHDCWANQWKSDAKQKGKACKNSRELSFVITDELDPDSDPELYTISISPTSVASFDASAVQIARLFNGPPIKAQMTMKVVQKGNYYNLQFGNIEAHEWLAELFPLRDDARDMLGLLPNFDSYEAPKFFPGGDVRNQQQPAKAAARGRR